jgi:hypothetical protein
MQNTDEVTSGHGCRRAENKDQILSDLTLKVGEKKLQ